MNHFSLPLVLALVAVATSAASLTVVVRSWAIRRSLLVHPSERCSHTIPTPHGGGIAIAFVSISLGLMFSVLDWLPDYSMLAFMLLGLAMVALGVWDDFGDVSPRLRLLAHFIVVGFGMASIPSLPVLSMFGVEVDSSATFLMWPLFAVCWVWLINLYNFMDGIDGLAALQALMLFAGMAFNFWYMGQVNWSWICLFMLAAVLGFTLLNWPPAKIFMGDGGSGFLGFVIGFMMLLSASLTHVSMWSWIILLTLFISDATTTLFIRLITGQNIMKAHRLHAYQKLTDRFGSHKKVTLGFGVVMLVVLLPCSIVANVYPHSGPFVFGSLFLVFSGVAGWLVGAGRLSGTGNVGSYD
ncbi:MraY family glycosyltransferase [Marinobacter daepoensis]|uniref:MraY family glycosyltransferase n=1 Tax=Marinobacter daepoensis TaxID=262077 RepID=UPI000403903B|nr:glycosyltransferase family 4 protein [Marinobacter daepoensis]